MMVTDHQVRTRRYPASSTFEREGDAFGIAAELNNVRKLVIYAKADDRIRFEVRRDGRSHYGRIGHGRTPTERLLNIVERERERAAAICRWAEIGERFAEPAAPCIGDLVEFMTLVGTACEDAPSAIRPLATALLADGGISPMIAGNVPSRVLDRLWRHGMIERVCIRSREPRRRLRFVLAPLYRDLQTGLLHAFGNDGQRPPPSPDPSLGDGPDR